MIRRAFAILWLLLPPSIAWADGMAGDAGTGAPEPDSATVSDSSADAGTAARPEEDHTLERWRTPFDALNDRKIGEASRAVRFDWRKATVGFGIVGSSLAEFNNFGSASFGGFVRTAVGSLIVELAVTWVFSWSDDSARKLALTPYRQFGRPARLEIGINAAFPLAEGVATPRTSFFPATELVFSLNAGLRYLYYPNALGTSNAGQVAGAIFAPKLTQREFDYLENVRQPAMQVDGARYSLLAGFSLDVYFQTGGFLEPRVLVALPVFSGLNGGGLGLWWELSLSLGWAL